ncbi:glycosyl hydrolase [Kitasatospora sp. NPDC092039]|uniref:glycosyl hydrolase n=1 Tax=Kitasatospora sp. NPDC092039 TaxID=3364086 RepID=UPI0037F63A5B
MTPKIDLQVDGLAPADKDSRRLRDKTKDGDFNVLAQHDAGERSFILAFDRTATWAALYGEPDLATFDVVRNRRQSSFSLQKAEHSNLSFARKWLIERGCPSDALHLAWMRPADELTIRVEDRVCRSGNRYEIVDQLAGDSDASEAWTMALDRSAAELPVRLFVEEVQPTQGTYTVREGAFPDVDTAWRWTRTDLGPLPLVPEDLAPETKRTRAALARSTTVPTASDTAAIVAAAPAAAVIARPDRGRSL